MLELQLIHKSDACPSEEHYGLILTIDSQLLRNKASIPPWVKDLEKALKNIPPTRR